MSTAKTVRTILRGLTLSAGAWSADGIAQEAATESTELQEVVVVGSQIKGATTAALPVTIVDPAEIAATGAVSGDDLFRSIPQMGDVSFNSTNGQTSSNFARGDVGSVDIRNLGVGNTLVLVNGRRTVAFPVSQASGSLAPVLTYNTNAIPVSGVQRLEVLRDGAGAIYGSDAVAGVVNTVLRSDYQGARISAQYGDAEGTHLREMNLDTVLGRNFAGDRGNVSLFANYTDRSAMRSTDQDFTRSSDTRSLFAATSFAGATALDNRSTTTPWGDFQTVGAVPVRRNGALLTTSGGIFHVQPSTNEGCRADLGGSRCIDDGSPATSGADVNLRWDAQANYPISVIPELERLNLFATSRFALNDKIELFGEAGYYQADTRSVQDSVFTIGSIRMTIPASNYWNPFGPVTFADGTANPNRLSGLNAPAAGLPITLRTLRFTDLGPTQVEVRNEQSRFLAGLRGKAFGFDWESALLYSEATVRDAQDGIDSAALQQNLALSTPDAYNPFNGGDPGNPGGPDTTLSNQAAAESFLIEAVRRGRSTLSSWDMRLSKSDLLSLWAGNLGLAAGTEYRRETQLDDRDPNVDGTITWFDSIAGVQQGSNLFGVSPTPDNRGSRNVKSAYIELAVPLVSPAMEIPLVRALDMQLAGRYEDYSDFGNVTKPKAALAWDVIDGVRFRGSISQGFRAPNLEQINATLVTRGNNATDFIRCEADLRAGRITSFSNCSRTVVATARRRGNPDLQPEESDNFTVGTVLQPRFIPESLGEYTLTVDYWEIQQEGIVGVFGGTNTLALDYLNRVQGSSNPAALRAAPTADDIAAFAGTGLAPVGELLYFDDQYRNLEPQDVSGIDFGLQWRMRDTAAGDFTVNFNAARIIKFFRDVSPDARLVLDARDAGIINAATALDEGGDLIRDNGNPEWRWTSSLTWKYQQLTLGALVRYTGGVGDTSLLDANGDAYRVESQTTVNLYGDYRFRDGWFEGANVRIGVRNLLNDQPPIADESFGYMGSVYSPYRRYWYASVGLEF